MLLTEQQLQEIRQIIADHHSAFIANTVSPQVIAPEILERLKQKGLYAPKVESIREAYLYGQVLATLANPTVASMNYEEFKRYIRTNPIPLTEIERQAIMVAQQQAGQYAVGLGNRVDQQTGQLLIEADHVLRGQLRDEIKTATAENIARRESVSQLKSDLGWATRDWARDWDRIAVTEKHSAMQHGLADSYAADYGADVRVAKRPMPSACEHCKRLHLGPDGQPRIFRLSDLIGNGTNFKKKTADWNPVVGPVHPHCACSLLRVPEGWGFDEEGRLVQGGLFGVEHKGGDLEAALREEDELRKSSEVVGTMVFQGLKIAIENPKGSTRHWVGPGGKKGTTVMRNPYGFIEGTRGQDDEEVDCYVGPDPRALAVYVVHQQNPVTKQYDEVKSFLGFSSKEAAEQAYRIHYDRPDFPLWTDTMDIEAFKRWVQKLTKSTPPRAERFVLRKGEFTGTTSATLSERAFSPGYGTGVNFAVGTKRVPVPTDPKLLNPQPRELLEDDDRFVPDSMKRDLDVYTVDPDPPTIVRRFDLPEEWGLDLKKLRRNSVKNRELVDTEAQRDKAVVRNTVEPEDSKPLVKSQEPGVFARKRVTRTPVITGVLR
jgi:hypothetical protein